MPVLGPAAPGLSGAHDGNHQWQQKQELQPAVAAKLGAYVNPGQLGFQPSRRPQVHRVHRKG